MANNVTLANSAVPWLSTNFDVAPYNDDTDETKNYERVLFKPTVAVQGRELNALQTYIQKQNARVTSSIYQEGSRIKGGAFNIDLTASYLRLQDTDPHGNTVSVSNFTGMTITGASSGVKAQVILVTDGTQAATPNTKTLVIKYTAVSSTTANTIFTVGEQLSSNNGFQATIINDPASIGNASYINIDAGIYFAKGFPVRTSPTSIILDKNSNTPSCRVGFTVAENIVTSIQDPSLLSNATGSPNFAAPGADRLQLQANLQTFGLTATLPAGYVDLVVIQNGVIQSQQQRTQFNDLMGSTLRD